MFFRWCLYLTYATHSAAIKPINHSLSLYCTQGRYHSCLQRHLALERIQMESHFREDNKKSGTPLEEMVLVLLHAIQALPLCDEKWTICRRFDRLLLVRLGSKFWKFLKCYCWRKKSKDQKIWKNTDVFISRGCSINTVVCK